MFIDISGIDGSGKSTTAYELKKFFICNDRKAIVFHGFRPRTNIHLLRDLCIKAGIPQDNSKHLNKLGMAAALMDIFENAFYISKKSNEYILISEKYIKDSIVYMPLLGGSSELPLIYEAHMPYPNYRFIMDIDPVIARDRVEKRSLISGKFIQEKESYEIMVLARKKFLSFANENNTFIIDASMNVEDIVKEIISIISQRELYMKYNG